MLVVMENNNDYMGYNFGDGYNDGLYCLLISFDGFKCGYISVNFEMFNNVLRLNGFVYDEIDEGWSDRLITSLKSIQTKYVLYMQEDQWPFKQIDANLFNLKYPSPI